MAAAAPTGTTNATGSTVHQTTGNAQITAKPGAAAQQAAQLQQPFGGDTGALFGVPPTFRIADRIGSASERNRGVGTKIREIQARVP
jgi:hypothetical protein